MKIFVAGATGALGRRLVPRLAANGNRGRHHPHPRQGAGAWRRRGHPMVLNTLDREAVLDAVGRAEPEVYVGEGVDPR
jgi:2-alkyl-3-oxoalkanoate reductase